MAIALVQNSASIAQSTTGTLPSNSTAGNLLVAWVDRVNVLDNSAPSGWIEADNPGTPNIQIFYYPNNPGGLSSFVFANATEVYIAEFSGVATSSPLDASGAGGSISSPITTTTTGNVTQANELAVGGACSQDSKPDTTTLAQTGGWTQLANNGGTSLSNHMMCLYKLNPASGSTLSNGFSTSTMNLNNLNGNIATFIVQPASTAPVGKYVSDLQDTGGLVTQQAVNRSTTY